MYCLGPTVLGAYITLCVVMGYSAVRHRRKGWQVGLLLALLMLTLPVWTVGVMWLLGVFPSD
jgi:ABC-type glycerol-3-phosphate transport system permease component